MIADDSARPFEVALGLLTAPVWLPIYLAYLGCLKVAFASANRKPKQSTEVTPAAVWTPATDLERAVFAAMILAGRPVTNAELARFMGVSPGEASRRVKALQGVLHKERIGREVRISLPSYH